MPRVAEWRAINPKELILLRGNLPRKQIGPSESTVKRIEGGDRVTEELALAYVDGLQRNKLTTKRLDDLMLRDPQTPGDQPDYSWKQINDGAIGVAAQVFEVFRPDAILTFAGASGIFAGMVCAAAAKDNVKVFSKPIYTAMLVNKAGPELDWCETILTQPENPAKQFKILVPKMVFSYGRVIVIDDTLISGVTMRALRREFGKPKHQGITIEFACCVCHSGLLTPDKLKPIVGIEKPVTKDNFEMPWGKAVCFEDLPL